MIGQGMVGNLATGVSLALLLASCALGSAELRQVRKDERHALEDELDALRHEYRIPGMSVAILRRQPGQASARRAGQELGDPPLLGSLL